MATLSRRAPRQDDQIDLHERDVRGIVELVDAWGLTRDAGRHGPAHDVRLDFDGFDRAHVYRTVADVWARR